MRTQRPASFLLARSGRAGTAAATVVAPGTRRAVTVAADCHGAAPRRVLRREGPLAARSAGWQGGGCVRRFCGLQEDGEPTYASGDLSGYKTFHQVEPFQLSTGKELPELKVAYETWGVLNPAKDNTILLQCGMSASSHAASTSTNPSAGWWEDYIGEGKALDTRLFFIICTNNLGGCYGTTGPSSFHPDGKRYGSRFPRFEVYDQVAAQFKLLDHLGIQKLHAAVGSSLGGMQSLCSAARFPDRVGKFVTISACAKSFPGSIAFRHAQRTSIMGDPNWSNGDYYDSKLPEAGLRLAREIGTITYRSGKEWQERFGQGRVSDERSGLLHEFQIEKYLSHQGSKWVNNYDPNSLLWISKAMDSFTLEKPGPDGKPSLAAGLADAQQPALVIGVQHDVLFPVWQQKEIADTLRTNGNKSVCYYELDSTQGHDTFLLSQETIAPAVKGHLEQEPCGAKHLWEEKSATFHRILSQISHLTNVPDMMRSIFRAVARDSDTAAREELHFATKLFLAKDGLHDGRIDHVFDVVLREKSHLTMKEYLDLREPLTHHSEETYLP